MAPTLLRGSKPPHLRLLKSSLETRLSAKGLWQRGMWGTPAFLPDTSDAGAWERPNRVLMEPISPSYAPTQPDAAKRFPLAGVTLETDVARQGHARHHPHRPTARCDAPRRLRASVLRARPRGDRPVARGHRPADADRPGLSRDARRPLQV